MRDRWELSKVGRHWVWQLERMRASRLGGDILDDDARKLLANLDDFCLEALAHAAVEAHGPNGLAWRGKGRHVHLSGRISAGFAGLWSRAEAGSGSVELAIVTEHGLRLTFAS